ncbi:putative PfkB family kinase [Aspergillus pseudonomiae]|uniref:Putative PfkB family kinase n=1 Tax=Aspergillus pseudonomiae TaxID=1506151 RepID=A0A5N7DU82_9EURO|nr:putative PfkB family kinase [Aspergillus pseudonomiae]KAB8261297.1 putative PfkB family kinase [Aspergillus pseudonomiae]KAE8410031.1 putative PfkB family kinase [Aspergillus pseudonomiae]
MNLHHISFTSLGLVVLDEIRLPNRKALTDILGGSGAYATLGARLFLPHPQSNSLGWMVHVGNDFPKPIEDRLQSWDVTLVIERESNQASTRGLLEYKDSTFGPKKFKYTTPILAIQDSSLKNTPLLTSRAYHYLETPQNITIRLSSLLVLREKSGVPERPLIIWEPAPFSCTAENLQSCLDAVCMVDVFSPNHLELAALFGQSRPAVADKDKIEAQALRFLDSGVGRDGKGTVIVRAGEHGCLVIARDTSPIWLPPFYRSRPGDTPHAKVVDPTGAGNAFLGAFAAGYLQTGCIVEAACYGSVGASFAVEQVGMPEKISDRGEELWNGANVLSRLHEYRKTI